MPGYRKRREHFSDAKRVLDDNSRQASCLRVLKSQERSLIREVRSSSGRKKFFAVEELNAIRDGKAALSQSIGCNLSVEVPITSAINGGEVSPPA